MCPDKFRNYCCNFDCSSFQIEENHPESQSTHDSATTQRPPSDQFCVPFFLFSPPHSALLQANFFPPIPSFWSLKSALLSQICSARLRNCNLQSWGIGEGSGGGLAPEEKENFLQNGAPELVNYRRFISSGSHPSNSIGLQVEPFFDCV